MFYSLHVTNIKKKERGSAILLTLAFSVVFLILLALLVSEILFSWRLYAQEKAKLLSQFMDSDIVSILRFEETRELIDGDDVYSYIHNVWEDPNMIHVMKYDPMDLSDDFNFLKYYPFPDVSGLSRYGVSPNSLMWIKGAFFLDSENNGSDELPNDHLVRIVGVVVSPGYSEDRIYSNLVSEYSTKGYVYAGNMRNILSDISFDIAWDSGEKIVMASGNAKEWGEQVRVKGDVWERPAEDVGVVNFKPVRTALNTWEVFDKNAPVSQPFAKSQNYLQFNIDGRYIDDHLMDSVVAGGKYHYGGTYFSVDQIPFGNGSSDNADTIIDSSGNAIVKQVNGNNENVTFYSNGKYRRYSVVSLLRKFLRDRDYSSPETSDSWNNDNNVVNAFVSSGLPWYRYVGSANWRIDGSGNIIPGSEDFIYWEYHLINKLLMSTDGDVSPYGETLKHFYTDVIMPNGYSTDDNRLFDAYFTGETWDDLIRNGDLAPVKRAQNNGDLITISGHNSYVVTLYTKYGLDGKLHTILRYAPGSCEYKRGCEESSTHVDVDLQDHSTTGNGILVDFGDDSTIYLVTPCQPKEDSWRPLWNDLCYPVFSPDKVGNIADRGSYIMTIDGDDYYKLGDSDGDDDDIADDVLLYIPSDINPLASNTGTTAVYNPNWKYEWTRFVPITENGFNNYFGGYSKDGVEAKIYHPNWKNMIQYNFKITMVANSLRVLGDVIPVPGSIKTESIPLYETDLNVPSSDLGKNSDIPNLSKLPYGEKLGFLLKGYHDASYSSSASEPDSDSGSGDAYSVWFWDKIGLINYEDYDTSDNQLYDFLSKGNKYGFRFAPDPDVYIGKDINNRDMDIDDNDGYNPYHWELRAWDKLFYADVYVKNGGVGFVYKYSYNTDLTDYRLFENYDIYKYPINSETFRLLGSMLMWGGRDVYEPVEFYLGRYFNTTSDPGWGFTSPIYYLPDNYFTNRLPYWLISTNEEMSNVKVTDIRMSP